MRTALLAIAAASIVTGPPLSGSGALPKVVQHIPLRDGGWDILTVDPEYHRVLVSRSDGVDAIDTRTGAVTAQFVRGARFHGVSVVPGTSLGVATEAAGTALVFNRATGKITAEVKTDPDADATVYDPTGRKVWVMNGDSGTISIIDPVGGKAVGKINVGSALEFADVDGRGHVFVNLTDKSELAEIDVATRKVMRVVPLAGCDHPTGLAYLKSGMLISACANGVAKVTRASDLQPARDIAIGPRPDGAFADAPRERAYSPSGGDGTLSVIDTSGPTPRKLAAITTAKGARTGTVDPLSGTVYSITARYGPTPPAGGRPPIIPGSVELLVIR